MNNLERLRHHVTGAIERGEAKAIIGQPAVTINSLAGFRRFLGTPGATVQVIRHDWAGKGSIGNKPEYWEPRTVKKLQTNAVKFSNDGWLHWDDRGGAKNFRFDNSDVVTVNLSADHSFVETFQYHCWIGGAS